MEYLEDNHPERFEVGWHLFPRIFRCAARYSGGRRLPETGGWRADDRDHLGWRRNVGVCARKFRKRLSVGELRSCRGLTT